MALRKGPGRLFEAKSMGREHGQRIMRLALLRVLKFRQTEQAPLLGTTVKMVGRWVHRYGKDLAAAEEFVRSVLPSTKPRAQLVTDVEGITDPKTYTLWLHTKLAAQAGVMERALVAEDIKVAMAAVQEMNKILQLTTKTKVEHGGKIEHEHTETVIHDVTPAMRQLVNQFHARKKLAPAFKEAEVVSRS